MKLLHVSEDLLPIADFKAPERWAAGLRSAGLGSASSGGHAWIDFGGTSPVFDGDMERGCDPRRLAKECTE